MSEISGPRSVRSNTSSGSSAGSRLFQLSLKYSASLEHHHHHQHSSERLTPRQFLDKYSLPRVVRVATDRQDEDERRLMLGPLAEPLLLYRQYKSTKVQARSVIAKTWKAVGPSLVIPDSYQGWFSQVGTKGQLVAHCYTSIQQLVSAQITRFLSKLELAAYRLNDGTSKVDVVRESVRKRLQYTKTIVHPGEVLKLLAVFEDVGASSGSQQRLSLPLLGKVVSSSKKYAQCLTHKNQMVFVPLSSNGQFYAVGAGDAPLCQLPQLLRDNRLPLRVQLVAGPLPTPLPIGFTGSLVLEGYQEEDVILACTLPGDHFKSGPPKLLEMDADSRFLLSRPLFHQEVESRLFKSPLLQTALGFCRDRGDIWRRQIKVTHHIFPSQPRSTTQQQQPQQQQQQQQQQQPPPLPQQNKPKGKSRRNTKKSSSFTYMPSSRTTEAQEAPRNLQSLGSPDDVPYGHVADALGDIDKYEEENIYAEICDFYCSREDYYYVQLEGGSDGTFSNTMSSSNPSSPDESNYDTVC